MSRDDATFLVSAGVGLLLGLRLSRRSARKVACATGKRPAAADTSPFSGDAFGDAAISPMQSPSGAPSSSSCGCNHA